MLKDQDIICISWLVWDSIPLVMHQMMSRLATHNRVLFVDPPVAYSNLLIKPALWKNHWQKTRWWLQGVRQVKTNLYVYYPPPLALQYGHLTTWDRFSQAYTASAILKIANQLEFNSPILWIYHPYAIMPQGQFNEKLVCYDCNDNVGFFFCQHFDKRKKLATMEESLVRRANVVFATSRYLFQLHKRQNPNTHYFPSGVDIEQFQKALSPTLQVAPELETISKPVIGFVGGMVNTKMHWDWIQETAISRPQWHFVFVGPCFDPPPSSIIQLKNITFVGARPIEDLPTYIKSFDVCLIPYQGEEFLKACSPTKAFEYLAAGKLVVASWIPELEGYYPLIRLSRDLKEFGQHIEAALVDGQKDSIVHQCVQTAQGRTWEQRVEQTSHLIASLL